MYTILSRASRRGREPNQLNRYTINERIYHADESIMCASEMNTEYKILQAAVHPARERLKIFQPASEHIKCMYVHIYRKCKCVYNLQALHTI